MEEFREWIRSVGGKISNCENEWGNYTRSDAPDGTGHVFLADHDPEKRLGPDEIFLLEKRLGITSPWTISH